MDIENIVLAVIIVLTALYIIKKGIHLFVIFVLGTCIFFTSVFVLKDVLHVPLDDYIDTTKVEAWRIDGTSRIEDSIKKVTDGILEEHFSDDFETAEGIVTEESEELFSERVNLSSSGVVEDGYYQFSYDEFDRESRLLVYDLLGHRTGDKTFKEKLLGMSPYVDIVYSNAKYEMYNESDNTVIIRIK